MFNTHIHFSLHLTPTCKINILAHFPKKNQNCHKQLTAATVSMSKTLVQYRQAFAFPYLVWHSSKGNESRDKANNQILNLQRTISSLLQACFNFLQSLTIKAIDLSDLPALVIATQQCDAVRPFGFKC